MHEYAEIKLCGGKGHDGAQLRRNNSIEVLVRATVPDVLDDIRSDTMSVKPVKPCGFHGQPCPNE